MVSHMELQKVFQAVNRKMELPHSASFQKEFKHFR